MKILFINPPVYDFALYDLWMKPLGFLYLANLFKKNNIEIFYFDFMDRNHPFYKKLKTDKKYGTGKFFFEVVEKPEVYKNVPKKFKRYGLPLPLFEEFISKQNKPDFIFITSGMTYWYLGVKEIINFCKKFFNSIPIILGGPYTTFCKKHAEKLGADYVFSGKDLKSFIKIFNEKYYLNLKEYNWWELEPAWELYKKLSYSCIKTSSGCPFSCYYCGIKLLEPLIFQREPDSVVEEIFKSVEKYCIEDIAFYDDALFYKFNSHLKIILEKIIKSKINVRFHTPNGIHPRYITSEAGYILKESNFVTIRLSLETILKKRQKESDFKVTFKEFENAIEILTNNGFTKENIGVYILIGLPEQKPQEVIETIKIIKNYPCKIKLAEYSPIPGTKDFVYAKNLYPFIQLDEPLLHNNSIFPLWDFKNKWEIIEEIKNLI